MSTSIAKRQFIIGVTLVELVVFIAIVSVALAGVLGVLNYVNSHGADPMVRKQAMAIADSLMQEVQQMPFTYCDLEDENVTTATSTAACASASQDTSITGPTPASESRYSATNPFDNVADYGGFTMPDANCAGICRLGDNTPTTGLNGYTATVALARVGGVGAFAAIPANDVLQITVTVNGPANTRVVLVGNRVRYAPRP